MSIKLGGDFLAGNIAIKVQDRLFTATRTLENNQEYYDIEVPAGCSLGFTQATKLALIISGTNTTTTPILRYQTNSFQIVGGSFNSPAPLKIGELRDGGLAEMYVGTSSEYIYLASNGDNYDTLHNTPVFRDKDGDLIPLPGGVTDYEDLGLPYVKDHILVVDNQDLLKINLSSFEYGVGFTKEHIFQSSQRLKWKKSVNETLELATLRDIEELAIGDQFVAVLTYCRDTLANMNLIEDMVSGDKCLVTANNTIYNYNGSSWVSYQELDYDDSDNGKYYEIEDIDGIHSGRAIWNIVEGGHFQIFIDYTNAIDNYTITRNSNQAIQVAKLLNSLTISVPREDKQIVFDGSSNQTLQIDIDLSDYYTQSEIDSYYNGNTSGNLAAFYTDTEDENNIKIHSLDISKANLVLKTSASYLQANNTDVDASLIKYTKTGYAGTTIKGFLDQDFAYENVANNFVAGQKIATELIATQPWAQTYVANYITNTLLPNKFDLGLLTTLSLVKDAPSATKTSLRYTTKNLNTGVTATADIELPAVDANNNGLATPTQKALWDTVTSKTPLTDVDTTNSISSGIGYSSHLPKIEATTSTDQGEASFTITSNVLEVKLLASTVSGSTYSGIVADKNGVYSYQDEAITKDNNHKLVNRGYLNSNAVMQDAIQTNATWSNAKVVLNDLSIINITASGASLEEKGSDVINKTSITTTKAFPIVSSTTAGLATAALYNQVEANRTAIEALSSLGTVGAHLGTNPSQSDIMGAWNTAKPTQAPLEGCNVINLDTGDTWRYVTVGSSLSWVNLGVLGGNSIATTSATGVVKSSADTSGNEGMVYVEMDGTMSVLGWDALTGDVADIDLALGNLEDAYEDHVSDVLTGNSYPHVSASDRTSWNGAVTTAGNAIPKVTNAVNNNLVQWSTGGVIKDSGKSFVTNFVTPTDNQIPTALAVNTLVGSKVDKETVNTEEVNNTTITYNKDVLTDIALLPQALAITATRDSTLFDQNPKGAMLMLHAGGYIEIQTADVSYNNSISVHDQGVTIGASSNSNNEYQVASLAVKPTGVETGNLKVGYITPNLLSSDIGTQQEPFNAIYANFLQTGGLKDGNNANYKLNLPNTTNWTTNKTIATTEYVDDLVGDIETLLTELNSGQGV